MSQDVLTTRWTETGEKIIALADEFPGERYGDAPAPGVRTFAEQLRHVAFWNRWLAGTLRGESPDGSANELPADGCATKPQIAAALRESVADAADAIAAAASDAGALDNAVAFIEHNGEHYGQLMMYFRMNGMVPPASRS